MSEPKAIEYFVEVDLKWSDFDAVSDDQKSAFAIACFAVTEVNALMKQYTFADHKLTGEPAIDYGILAHSHVILRTWSAKLFEFSKFVTFKDKSDRTKDEKLLKISGCAIKKFEPLKMLSGYRTAESLRHETSNHYHLLPVKKNLKFVSSKANCRMYLHKQNGNSLYPIGDEIVFVARMNRQASTITDENERAKIYDEWWNWNLAATRWLHDVHYEICESVIPGGMRDRRKKRSMYWVDPRLVGVPEQVKTPVVMRTAE